MLVALALAALLLAPVPAVPAPLDAAACEAIPGAPDEGPRFEDPEGVFSLNLPSSWVQRDTPSLGLTQADAAIHGDRAVFDLRQGDVHRQLIVRVLAPNGTRAEDAARLAGGLGYGVGNAVTHDGAPCNWVGFQGAGHARKRSLVCDLKLRNTPARFVLDMSYLDTDTCDHRAELHSIVDTLKWGVGVTPGAQ